MAPRAGTIIGQTRIGDWMGGFIGGEMKIRDGNILVLFNLFKN
jgi:hypothetical protein